MKKITVIIPDEMYETFKEYWLTRMSTEGLLCDLPTPQHELMKSIMEGIKQGLDTIELAYK